MKHFIKKNKMILATITLSLIVAVLVAIFFEHPGYDACDKNCINLIMFSSLLR